TTPTPLLPNPSLCPIGSPLHINNPAPTDIYTLSLHDALPICSRPVHWCRRDSARGSRRGAASTPGVACRRRNGRYPPVSAPASRSEEHTSELQSRRELVCRLLLEKKKAGTQTSVRAYRHRKSW